MIDQLHAQSHCSCNIRANDPFAREAVMLARRYLRGDHNLHILETLVANEHSAYREALTVLKCTIPETGTAIPEQQRVWEPDGKDVIKRLWRERTRNQLTSFPGSGVRSRRSTEWLRYRTECGGNDGELWGEGPGRGNRACQNTGSEARIRNIRFSCSCAIEAALSRRVRDFSTRRTIGGFW